MASVNFIFRPSTQVGKHEGSLSLRVVHARKPKSVVIPCRLFPEEWDAATQSIRFPTNNPQRLEYLLTVQERANAYRKKMIRVIQRLENRKTYSAADIIIHFKGPEDGNLLGFVQILSIELNDSKRYRTARAYETVCRGLVDFNNGVDLALIRITPGLIKQFETYLKELGKHPNTISFYMRNLRAIYNKAVELEFIPAVKDKPFSSVFTGIEETRKRALNADEVSRLKNIDFDKLLARYLPDSYKRIHIKNLYYAWRLFFFSLYAQGMSFVDLCHLKKTNIKGDEIRYYRKKTGGQVIVPINNGMQQIIGSFAHDVKDSPYLFPILGNERENTRNLYEAATRSQNRRLKRLAKLVGIDKEISTHVARHSWATICKNEMLPVSVISEGLGHSSEKMTRKYLDTFDHSILGKAGTTILTATSRHLPGSFQIVLQRKNVCRNKE